MNDGGFPGGFGVVRKLRENDDFLRPVGGELTNDGLGGGRAVAHGDVNGRRVAERIGEALTERFGVNRKRRALGRPDFLIKRGRMFGAERQNDALEQKFAEQPRERDDALVSEEGAEEAPDGGNGRLARRTECEQDDSALGSRHETCLSDVDDALVNRRP